MTAADLLLAAARELRLRCFMGPVPFDVDGWLEQELECDVPRLSPEEEARGYHFEVRSAGYIGTYFELRCDGEGRPCLDVGGGGTHPADLDGWRAAVDEFNLFSRSRHPRKYIFLHGYWHLARQADDEE